MLDPESGGESASLSRRSFGRGVVAAATVALLPGTLPGAAATAAATPGTRPEDLSAADWEELHSRYANLLRVYGERLSPEEKLRARRILTTNQQMLASIRAFAVQNGDASACTLRVVSTSAGSDPQQAPRS